MRIFFIPAHGQFTVKALRAGQYDIRYRDLKSGRLTRVEPFSLKETRTSDGVIEYDKFSLTLFKVPSGNLQSFPLSEAEF